MGNVVAVAATLLNGVTGRKPVPGLVEQKACQEVLAPAVPGQLPGWCMCLELDLNGVPDLGIDDARMTTGVNLAPVPDHAAIDRVGQDCSEMSPAEGYSSLLPTIGET